jgi:hypothetical protein
VYTASKSSPWDRANVNLYGTVTDVPSCLASYLPLFPTPLPQGLFPTLKSLSCKFSSQGMLPKNPVQNSCQQNLYKNTNFCIYHNQSVDLATLDPFPDNTNQVELNKGGPPSQKMCSAVLPSPAHPTPSPYWPFPGL